MILLYNRLAIDKLPDWKDQDSHDIGIAAPQYSSVRLNLALHVPPFTLLNCPLTGLMLMVTPSDRILGATGRVFHAAARVLNGWVALPTATAPL